MHLTSYGYIKLLSYNCDEIDLDCVTENEQGKLITELKALEIISGKPIFRMQVYLVSPWRRN